MVLKALQLILQPYFDPFNAPFSYAYRKSPTEIKFSVETAVAHVISLAGRFPFALEADLQKYFDNVPKEKLKQAVFKVIRLKSLDQLLVDALAIEAKIQATLGEDTPVEAQFFESPRGIPQGSALSPLLSNFYLAPFDWYMTKAGFELVRYADDIMVFAESSQHALVAYEKAAKILRALGLGIHPLGVPDAKSKVRNLTREGLECLGFRIEQGKVLPGSKSMRNFLHDIKGLTNPSTLGRGIDGSKEFDSRDNVLSRISSLIRKVEGKAASLRCCDNCQQISDMDKVVRDRFVALFKSCGLDFSLVHGRYQIRLGVPRFRRAWRRQVKKFTRREINVPGSAGIIDWSTIMSKPLSRCFPLLKEID